MIKNHIYQDYHLGKKYRKNDLIMPQLNNKSLISKDWNPNYDLETGLNKLIENMKEDKKC